MIRKYIRVTWIMIKNSYIRDSIIPGFILSKYLTQIIEIALMIIFFKIIFANTSSLGGWDYYQVLFLYCYSRSITIFHDLIFRKGLTSFAKTLVRKGDYDYYLVKPINPMYLVSVSNPRVYMVISFLFYVIVSIYAIIMRGAEVQIINIFWLILLSVVGIILYYFLSILTIALTFWFVRLYTLKEATAKASVLMRYPLDIYPTSLKIAFLLLFPILTVSYIPAKMVFYPPNAIYIIFMITITIIFGLLVNKIWKTGEKHYSSASS